MVETVSSFIKDKLEESKAEKIVIGLSGGIDSSVVAYLSARAVENDKIIGLVLPSETSSSEDIEDAVKVAEELKIEYKILHVDELIKPFPQMCPSAARAI